MLANPLTLLRPHCGFLTFSARNYIKDFWAQKTVSPYLYRTVKHPHQKAFQHKKKLKVSIYTHEGNYYYFNYFKIILQNIVDFPAPSGIKRYRKEGAQKYMSTPFGRKYIMECMLKGHLFRAEY